jgi:ABC-2 type transport system permease protein
MKAVLFREINSFFGSPMGYLVIAIFLTLNGLFLWVFDGEFNILNSGFADLSPFFTLAPWILIFLIPAVTMRSFSDERKQGTLELLLTKPLSIASVVNGKFFAALLLIAIAIMPTLLYGSYFGLFFLIAAYAAIGIFTSSLSDNQIIAFIIAVFLCFVFYFGFEGIGSYFGTFQSTVSGIGMDAHFKSMARGVLDTRDILYFVSITVLFLALTVYKLKALKS